jgi:hypothetical protein
MNAPLSPELVLFVVTNYTAVPSLTTTPSVLLHSASGQICRGGLVGGMDEKDAPAYSASSRSPFDWRMPALRSAVTPPINTPSPSRCWPMRSKSMRDASPRVAGETIARLNFHACNWHKTTLLQQSRIIRANADSVIASENVS